jgi:hypothetical protein
MFLCCLYKRGKYTAGQLEMFPLTLGSFELLFYHLECEQGQFIRPTPRRRGRRISTTRGGGEGWGDRKGEGDRKGKGIETEMGG